MNHTTSTPVAVIGAGVAGIAAAIWLTDYGVPFQWLAKDGQIGGMLHRVQNRIDNYPGLTFENGAGLIDDLRAQLRRRELAPRKGRISRIETGDDLLILHLDQEAAPITAQRVILATGAEYRRLGVAGEREGIGRWISQSATADAPRFAGRAVAVVGGGDAGFENALRLAENHCDVTLLLRNPNFRARTTFVSAVEDHPRITIAPIPSRIRRIEPTEEGCRLTIDQGDSTSTMNVAALFVRIGVKARIPAGLDAMERDNRGFLLVDPNLRSSDPRLLAAGDVVSSPLRSLITAGAQGALAARICAGELDYL